KNYEADFFHFDWFSVFPCTQKSHNHLPNGWDAVDKQHEAFIDTLTDMRKENPSVVLQSGGGCLSVHWMKWLSHSFFHDIWPGPIADLSYTRSCGADCRERLHKYAKGGFSPMMLISDWTDAGGELTRNPFGWKDSFVGALALTPTLRLEAGLYSYGRKELDWMKKWMDWRSTHTHGYSNVRFLWGHPFERGTEGYSFIDDSKGYLFFVNNEYADHDISVSMDESIGITDRKQRFEVKLLYPTEAVLSNQGKAYFEYNDTINMRLPFKAIRYLSVFPYNSKPEMKMVEDLPPKSDRWVVTTDNVTSQSLLESLQYSAELSLTGKDLPEKKYKEGPVDTSVNLNLDMVNEQPADKVYLLLYGEKIIDSDKIPDNPFEGLQVWVNDAAIGGTIKSQIRRHPIRKDMPFFYSDVTNVVIDGRNTIRWTLNRSAHKINEVILVREADE
ncbi:hypothetical protein KAR91_31570, partial [Candidatus Pacearchaeota archaeon]|nr:hypothetical protein [Candidatus Pacearchaeota archaeon]